MAEIIITTVNDVLTAPVTALVYSLNHRNSAVREAVRSRLKRHDFRELVRIAVEPALGGNRTAFEIGPLRLYLAEIVGDRLPELVAFALEPHTEEIVEFRELTVHFARSNAVSLLSFAPPGVVPLLVERLREATEHETTIIVQVLARHSALTVEFVQDVVAIDRGLAEFVVECVRAAMHRKDDHATFRLFAHIVGLRPVLLRQVLSELEGWDRARDYDEERGQPTGLLGERQARLDLVKKVALPLLVDTEYAAPVAEIARKEDDGINALCEVLSDEELQNGAKAALASIGTDAVTPVAGLLENILLRNEALDILTQIGADAVPPLIEDGLFESAHAPYGEELLRRIGANAIAKALSTLAMRLGEQCPLPLDAGRRALSPIAAVGEPALKVLCDTLQSETANPAFFRAAVFAILELKLSCALRLAPVLECPAGAPYGAAALILRGALDRTVLLALETERRQALLAEVARLDEFGLPALVHLLADNRFADDCATIWRSYFCGNPKRGLIVLHDAERTTRETMERFLLQDWPDDVAHALLTMMAEPQWDLAIPLLVRYSERVIPRLIHFLGDSAKSRRAAMCLRRFGSELDPRLQGLVLSWLRALREGTTSSDRESLASHVAIEILGERESRETTRVLLECVIGAPKRQQLLAATALERFTPQHIVRYDGRIKTAIEHESDLDVIRALISIAEEIGPTARIRRAMEKRVAQQETSPAIRRSLEIALTAM